MAIPFDEEHARWDDDILYYFGDVARAPKMELPPEEPDVYVGPSFDEETLSPEDERSLEDDLKRMDMMERSPALEEIALKHDFDPIGAMSWHDYVGGSVDVVVKVSGSQATNEVAESIALLSKIFDVRVILGCGENITQRCIAEGIPIEMEGPWRATPFRVMEIVKQEMTSLTTQFSSMVEMYGGNARAYIGDETNPLFFAQRLQKFPIKNSKIDPGFFGIIPISYGGQYITPTLRNALANPQNTISIVASLGHEWESSPQLDEWYQALNVDADELMGRSLRSSGLYPDVVVYVTPAGGVRNEQGKVIPYIDALTYDDIRDSQDVGMRTKLDEAFRLHKFYPTAEIALVPGENLIPYLCDRQDWTTTSGISGAEQPHAAPQLRKGRFVGTLIRPAEMTL